MTTPVPGAQRPPAHGATSASSSRSVADVAAGVAAVLVLAALTIGVPVALLTVVGLPIPHALPGLSVFARQLGTATILRVLSVVVWLAWLQLVVCVIAEVRAAVRNSGMPARIPLAGGTQALVHKLVTTALVLASATTALSPALVPVTPPHPSHVSSAGARAGAAAGLAGPLAGPESGGHGLAVAGGHGLAVAGGHGLAVTGGHGLAVTGGDGVAVAGRQGRVDGQGPADGQQPVPDPQEHRTEKIYVVRPPAGRYHQSLWEIAEDHLGNGRRYQEIYQLNKGRPQPDGSELTIASLIRPGWVLRMPRDAYGPGIEVVTTGRSGAPAGAKGGGHTGAVPAAGAAVHAAAGERAASGERAGAPGQAAAPDDARAPDSRSRTPLPAVDTTAPPGPGLGVYPAELAAASLLAAGLLSALGRRRRVQLWSRAFGRRVATASGEAAVAEVGLRLSASQPQARMLDVGLRHLSQALARQGRPLPTVFAAHSAEDELDLWVAPADRGAPAPWMAVGDGEVWRLPATAAARLDPAVVSRVLAPYPGLVTIGTDSTGRVLVDLESAHGLIALTGPAQLVTSALAAMAAELATNSWSDEMRITMVGFGGDLAVLAPDRMTSVPTLAEAIPALAARTAEVAQALAASGMFSVLTGRSQGVRAQDWAPHYLISAVTPTPAERDQLLALARSRHDAATGYVIAGEVEGATWTWELTQEGRLGTGLLGLDVRAQLLPPRQQRSVVELFRVAAGQPGEELAALAPGIVPDEQLDLNLAMPVEITLLGPVSVRAPGTIEPGRAALATELIAYLATHPGGVHPSVLAAAIWPRGVTADVREGTLARVREWLGSDGIGRPHLATDASGRLRLGSQVRVDWDVFRALIARAAQADGAGGWDAGAADAETCLARALSLVTGPFASGRQPGRYAWLAADGLEGEVPARVADAAHQLAELRRRRGDPAGAMDAARAGLLLACDDELLWRDLLWAGHEVGDPGLLPDLVAEVCARAAPDGMAERMSPQTEALIDELLPAWRSSVA